MSYDPPPKPGERRPRDTRVGNERCPCGSKRKFRKCCGAGPVLLYDDTPDPATLPLWPTPRK